MSEGILQIPNGTSTDTTAMGAYDLTPGQPEAGNYAPRRPYSRRMLTRGQIEKRLADARYALNQTEAEILAADGFWQVARARKLARDAQWLHVRINALEEVLGDGAGNNKHEEAGR